MNISIIMKPKSLKLITLLLSVLVLLQGCKIYDKTISVSEAASIRKPVRITDISDKKYIYKEIYYENNQLFGKRPGIFQSKKMLLNIDDIGTIHMINTRKDFKNRVGLVLGLLAIVAGLIYVAISGVPWNKS